MRIVMPRMHVISRRALREFWELHPPAKESLAAWYRLIRSAAFDSFNAIRRVFPAADYVAPYTIFDVGGNKYRVVAVIHFNRRRIYIRHVFTHVAYDRWSSERRSSKGKKRRKP